VNVTVPVGVILVPVEVSVTVALQLVELPSLTGLVVHVTVMLVLRLVAVTAAVPELP